MDLRRIRLQLTVIFTLLCAFAVAVIAYYAADAGSDRIYRSAEIEARRLHSETLLKVNAGEKNIEAPGWIVNVEEGVFNPFDKDGSLEPPLRSIIGRSSGSTSTDLVRFESEGRDYLAATRKLVADENNKYFLVTATDYTRFQQEASGLRRRIWLAAAALTALCGGVGYWFAKRSLEPAHTVLAQQRDFIADAAHEMRTPLAIIRASASHALSRPRKPEEYQQSLGEILAATERAGIGVGELLELARLDAGQARPRLAPLRVDLLVEEVAAAVRVDGVEVIARQGDPLIVDADYVLLQQVVENLCRNAAARASKVELSTSRYTTWALIDIADDGPGFDPDLLPHVFERFRRGDGKGGAGLGMAIAKGIVEGHHGRIDASNRAEGGALVRITLPLARSS